MCSSSWLAVVQSKRLTHVSILKPWVTFYVMIGDIWRLYDILRLLNGVVPYSMSLFSIYAQMVPIISVQINVITMYLGLKS